MMGTSGGLSRTGSNPLIVEWNVSWIDDDGDTGWVDFDQNVSGLECTFRTRGSHDNPPTYDRSALPSIVTAAWMETRLATPGHHLGLTSIAFEVVSPMICGDRATGDHRVDWTYRIFARPIRSGG